MVYEKKKRFNMLYITMYVIIFSLSVGYVLSPGKVYSSMPDITINLHPANPVLSYSGTGWYQGSGFDASRASGPLVLKVNGQYYMYYVGLPYSNNYQTGLATSGDGISWTKYAGNPVLKSSTRDWCAYTVAAVSAMYENSTFKLYLWGTHANLQPITGLGQATSPDGLNFVIGQNFIMPGVRVASVVKFKGKYYMYYFHGEDWSTFYYAISNDGVQFTETGTIPTGGKWPGPFIVHAYNGTEFIFAIAGDGTNYYHGYSLNGTDFTFHPNPINFAQVGQPMGITSILIEGGLIKFWGSHGVGNITWGYGNEQILYATATQPDFSYVLEGQPPTPSKTASKLVADVDPRNPSVAGRTPLILIHGIHGTDSATFSSINGSTNGEKTYFHNFIEYFYSGDLKDRYRLYRFHYLSDQLPVTDIAQGLKEWLDDFIRQGNILDGKYAIVAHSMGGLVARSYMQEQTHASGGYAGQPAGERILKLITLGTPHHGTPGANEDARITPSGLWSTTLNILDEFYWGVNGPSVTQPNRSDLRWDNYNAMQGYDAPNELNAWLASLNTNIHYSDKIIAYYGNMVTSENSLFDLWTYLNGLSPVDFVGWYGSCAILGYIPSSKNPYGHDIPFDDHAKLVAASVVLNKFYLITNDGMVPIDSGQVFGKTLAKVEMLKGYDHLDMKDDKNLMPVLFGKVRADLINASSLYAFFPSDGLYSRNDITWTLLTKDQPATMLASGSSLYASFAGYGLYLWDGSVWTLLTKDQPTTMLASGPMLYADFPGWGLYSWNGTTWTKLTKDHPRDMIVSGSMLYAYFSGDGLYSWNGTSWTRLTNVQPQSMVASSSTLYAYFPSDGLYSWNGSAWTLPTKDQPSTMVASGSTLYADFAAWGVYSWNGTTWTKLTSSHPTQMAASSSTLYAFFTGDGLYQWNGSWTLLTKDMPTTMLASPSTLNADFAVYGLYTWDGTIWTKLTSSHPATMLVDGGN